MATTPESARVEQQIPEPAGAVDHWFALDQAAVLAKVGSDAERGLSQAEAASRLSQYGPNQITGEQPPSVWQVALAQLRDPMNIMLVAVTVVSFAIGEVPTGIIVAALILLNVVLGSRQELKARASVDALSKMQVPQSRVVRDGHVAVGAGDRDRAGRRPAGGGGRHPAGGRPHPALGDAGGAGGRPDRRERSGRQGRRRPRERRRRARRPVEHALPEHVRHARDRDDGRHGDRHGHGDGPDRDDAHVGHAGPLAAAEGARLADQGARDHRLDRGRVHRRRRPAARPAVRRPGAARDRDGDLGDPDRHAGVRLRSPRARREAARRGARRRQEPHGRRDARGDQRDQHRQDRHADDERDDGLDHLRERERGSASAATATRRPVPSSRSPVRRSRTSRGSRSRSCSTATPPSATTAASSAIRPRRRSSCSRRSWASARRRRDAPTRAWPRCRSTRTTSSWPRSTARRSTGPSTSSSSSRAGRTSCSRAARRPAGR